MEGTLRIAGCVLTAAHTMITQDNAWLLVLAAFRAVHGSFTPRQTQFCVYQRAIAHPFWGRVLAGRFIYARLPDMLAHMWAYMDLLIRLRAPPQQACTHVGTAWGRVAACR